MNVLFFTHHYPNYVPDLLLHGLRKIIGPTVVDFPRKDCLYEGVLGIGVCPSSQRCPGWFPDDAGRIDRDDIPAKIGSGYFDLIVSDYRAVPQIASWIDTSKVKLAIVEGEDQPKTIPIGRYAVFRRETNGADHSIPLPMALPEEIYAWIRRYDDLPKKYSIGFLGGTADETRRKAIDQLNEWYPDALLHTSEIPTDANPNPEGRLGRDAYYRLLQQCHAVLSLPGSGYDTFRFWENAACNSIHCCLSMPLLIPFDFENDVQVIRFKTLDQMRHRLDKMLAAFESIGQTIERARQHLLQHHLTHHRAHYFIDQVKRVFQA